MPGRLLPASMPTNNANVARPRPRPRRRAAIALTIIDSDTDDTIIARARSDGSRDVPLEANQSGSDDTNAGYPRDQAAEHDSSPDEADVVDEPAEADEVVEREAVSSDGDDDGGSLVEFVAHPLEVETTQSSSSEEESAQSTQTSTSSVGGGDALAEQQDVENDPEGLYVPPGDHGQPHEVLNEEDDEDNEADEEDNGDGADYWDPPSSPIGSQLSDVTVVPVAAHAPEAVPANIVGAADPAAAAAAAAALLGEPAHAPEAENEAAAAADIPDDLAHLFDDDDAALLGEPAHAPEAENEAAAAADIPDDLAHLFDDDDFDWDWQPELEEPEHDAYAANAGGVLGPAAAPPQAHEDGDTELEEQGFSVTSVKRAGEELNQQHAKMVKVSAKVVCEVRESADLQRHNALVVDHVQLPQWIHDDRAAGDLQPWTHGDEDHFNSGPGLLRARRLDNEVLQVMVFPNVWASATALLLHRALLPPSCGGCRDEAVTISVKVEASA
ncbi:hypothetical protein CF326_g1549 [Tilletia indica]|nr:hypothetical protein CF326_g1549 [Tilletia indica]